MTAEFQPLRFDMKSPTEMTSMDVPVREENNKTENE